MKADSPILMEAYYSYSIQIDGCGQHLAMLMVSVVATYLGTAWSGKYLHIFSLRIEGGKLFYSLAVTLLLSSQSLLT